MSSLPTVDGAIASVIAAKGSAVQSQIGYAIAGKQLDAIEQQGQAAVSLLESATRLSKAVGRGSQFDTQG